MIRLHTEDDRYWHFLDFFKGYIIRMKIEKFTFQIDINSDDVIALSEVDGMAEVLKTDKHCLTLFLEGVKAGFSLSKQGYVLNE